MKLEKQEFQYQESAHLNISNSLSEEDQDIGMPLSPTSCKKVLSPSETVLNESPKLLNVTLPTQQREYIMALLFQNPNICITSSSQYDPALRFC